MLAALAWTIFCAGLLLQLFTPHLQIVDHKFVIPPSLTQGSKGVHPANIVEHERRIQWLSAILTVGGALGIGVCYRRVLVDQFRRG